MLGEPPRGSEDAVEPEELAAMKQVGERADGIIVWSSSRVGNHDLFTMHTDGSHVKAITSGENVDWFPRFSPDGSRILFCRSKKGWVSERDANNSDKWDIYTINADGSVSNVDVLNARPRGMFERPVQNAVRKWRFAPTSGPQNMTRTFSFAP